MEMQKPSVDRLLAKLEKMGGAPHDMALAHVKAYEDDPSFSSYLVHYPHLQYVQVPIDQLEASLVDGLCDALLQPRVNYELSVSTSQIGLDGS